MSGFDLSWLDLREPADHAARDQTLLRRAAAWTDAGEGVVVDLGCGSGSTFRALGPRLTRPATWRLVDNDPVLLAAAAARMGPGTETVEADLAVVDALPLAGARLVTASALLDLVSGGWIEALIRRLGGAALYSALSYNGSMHWERRHLLDGKVVSTFNMHQQTDKGFGRALGPDGDGVAVEWLLEAGYDVRTAQSPWRLGAGEAELERELLRGVAAAVRETGRIAEAELDAWLAMRLSAVGGCTVGHADFLALPPG